MKEQNHSLKERMVSFLLQTRGLSNSKNIQVASTKQIANEWFYISKALGLFVQMKSYLESK
jgi:hypothetical protein